MKRKVDILDVTLRDGSYTIGYQFSLLDNIKISAGLERAGVKYIEIGHGLGLGSYRKDNHYQAHSDIDYMQAVSETLIDSKFGFFFIPGIGNDEDLRKLKDHGGSFFRIGTGIENFDSAIDFIKLANKLKLKFWINLMKSYVYSYKQFAEFAKIAFLEGAEGVYLVDSAGGMLPKEVGNYMLEAKELLEKENYNNFSLGFHGHENLSLGVACSLEAVENGADIVDGSLLGIGRSIGNSSIETLAMVLKKSNFNIDINPWQLSDLAEKSIRPYLENRWRQSSVEQALGFKEIHSGFLKKISEYSLKNDLNLRDLILALPDEANKHVYDHHFEHAEKQMALASNNISRKLRIKSDSLNELRIPSSIDKYIKNLVSQSEKTNRNSVLIFTSSWTEKSDLDFSLQKIKTIGDHEVGSVEINHSYELEALRLDRIDYIMLDRELKNNLNFFNQMNSFPSHRVFTYSDKNSIFSHVSRYISVLSNKINFSPIVYCHLSEQNDEVLFQSLLDGYGIKYVNKPHEANIHILISKLKSKYYAQDFRDLEYVIDLRSGILDNKNISYCLDNDIELVAIDCEAAVVSEVLANIASEKSINEEYGSRVISGIRIVAKGKWGKSGNIVVDKINKPSTIIGICDGLGGLKKMHSPVDKKNINHITNFIINQ